MRINVEVRRDYLYIHNLMMKLKKTVLNIFFYISALNYKFDIWGGVKILMYQFCDFMRSVNRGNLMDCSRSIFYSGVCHVG